MSTLTNCSNRGIVINGWRVLPNSSKAVNPSGDIVTEVPDAVTFSTLATRLFRSGLLKINGRSYAPVEAVTPDEPDVVREAPAEEATSHIEQVEITPVDTPPKKRRKRKN